MKDYCARRGLIPRQGTASLDVLLEKTTGQFLSKDRNIRQCNDWETRSLHPDLVQYAALDVYASRAIFDEASKTAPLPCIESSTPLGTRVVLLVQEGGQPAAYGKISLNQPSSFGRVRVKVPTNSRFLIEIDTVLIENAAAILHLLPGTTSHGSKTKVNALTLGQLQAASRTSTFCVVAPLSHLEYDLGVRETNPTVAVKVFLPYYIY